MTLQNGGPAFPRPTSEQDPQNDTLQYDAQTGMTLRDWFAGQALSGLANHADFDHYEQESHSANLATLAYAIADAMLKAQYR